METLEKRYNQLKMAATELAVAIGEAGLMDQIKGVVDGTRDTIEWFNGLSDTTRGLIIVFAEFAIGLKLIRTLLAMGGITTAGGLVGDTYCLKRCSYGIGGSIGWPLGACPYCCWCRYCDIDYSA
jgi:hypothetical protein